MSRDPKILSREVLQQSMGKDWYEYLLNARIDFLKQYRIDTVKLNKIYQKAAVRLIRDYRAARSPYAKFSTAQLLRSIEREAGVLNRDLLKLIRATIADSYRLAAQVPEKVLSDMFDLIDGRRINHVGIHRLFVSTNRKAIEYLYLRTLNDGLKLSDRVWRISQGYQKAVTRVIKDSLTSGEDVAKAARKLDAYLRGRTPVTQYKNMMKRMGTRIPKDISYEALRLLRSETSNAFQTAAVKSSKLNPGYEGIYWMISPDHPYPDICDELAKGENGEGFWSEGNEPVFPHPNCMCSTAPKYVSAAQWKSRAQQWTDDPSSDPQLEWWYQNVYLKEVA